MRILKRFKNSKEDPITEEIKQDYMTQEDPITDDPKEV